MALLAAVAIVMLAAITAMPQADAVYGTTTDDYKTLLEKFLDRVNNVFVLAKRTPDRRYVKLTYESQVGKAKATACDVQGTVTTSNGPANVYSAVDFCPKENVASSTHLECTETIKQIFEVASTKSSSGLPTGVFELCGHLKARMDVTKSLMKCN